VILGSRGKLPSDAPFRADYEHRKARRGWPDKPGHDGCDNPTVSGHALMVGTLGENSRIFLGGPTGAQHRGMPQLGKSGGKIRQVVSGSPAIESRRIFLRDVGSGRTINFGITVLKPFL
jgi:hypothetical protein